MAQQWEGQHEAKKTCQIFISLAFPALSDAPKCSTLCGNDWVCTWAMSSYKVQQTQSSKKGGAVLPKKNTSDFRHLQHSSKSYFLNKRNQAQVEDGKYHISHASQSSNQLAQHLSIDHMVRSMPLHRSQLVLLLSCSPVPTVAAVRKSWSRVVSLKNIASNVTAKFNGRQSSL